MTYNYQIRGMDKDNVMKHVELLSELIKRNPSAVWNQSTLLDGVKMVDVIWKGKLSNGRSSKTISNIATDIKQMLMMVARTKMNMTVGTRVEPWLKSVCNLMDMPRTPSRNFGEIVPAGHSENYEQEPKRRLLKRETTLSSECTEDHRLGGGATLTIFRVREEGVS